MSDGGYLGGFQGVGPLVPRPEGLSGDPGRSGENALGRATPVGVNRRDVTHPWLATSTWGRALRVFLSALAVWLLALLVSVLAFADGRLEYFASSVPGAVALVVLPPVGCAVLAVALQPWLARLAVPTQALLVGIAAYVAAVLISAFAQLAWADGGIGCLAGEPCITGFWQTAAFAALILLPANVLGAIAYAIAHVSVTARGRWAFVGVLALALVVTVAFAVTALT